MKDFQKESEKFLKYLKKRKASKKAINKIRNILENIEFKINGSAYHFFNLLSLIKYTKGEIKGIGDHRNIKINKDGGYTIMFEGMKYQYDERVLFEIESLITKIKSSLDFLSYLIYFFYLEVKKKNLEQLKNSLNKNYSQDILTQLINKEWDSWIKNINLIRDKLLHLSALTSKKLINNSSKSCLKFSGLRIPFTSKYYFNIEEKVKINDVELKINESNIRLMNILKKSLKGNINLHNKVLKILVKNKKKFIKNKL